jgi:hypothetical protein
MEYTLVELPYTWNTQPVEGALVVGHKGAKGRITGDAFHVSAKWLQSKLPPSKLKKALVAGNPGAPICDESYNKLRRSNKVVHIQGAYQGPVQWAPELTESHPNDVCSHHQSRQVASFHPSKGKHLRTWEP